MHARGIAAVEEAPIPGRCNHILPALMNIFVRSTERHQQRTGVACAIGVFDADIRHLRLMVRRSEIAQHYLAPKPRSHISTYLYSTFLLLCLQFVVFIQVLSLLGVRKTRSFSVLHVGVWILVWLLDDLLSSVQVCRHS